MWNNLDFDTAKLGTPSGLARAAHDEFFQLVSQSPASSTLHRFLVGDTKLNEQLASDYPLPILDSWNGIRSFLGRLINLAGISTAEAFVASRSKPLVSFGLTQLFKSCNRCLVVDSFWPPYLQLLNRIAKDCNGSVVSCNVLQEILNQECSESDLCAMIADKFVACQCDSLVLPHVDHLGCMLPISGIIEYLDKIAAKPRFVFLDVSQSIGHVSLQPAVEAVDFIVGGTHKWLRSYLPLSFALATNWQTTERFHFEMQGAMDSGKIDDALLCYVENLKNCRLASTETFNLTPIFSAFGATLNVTADRSEEVSIRIDNANDIATIAEHAGWKCIRPLPAFRTGILLLTLPKWTGRLCPIDDLEAHFSKHRIRLSVFDNGLVRLAMPAERLTELDLTRLHIAFSLIAQSQGQEITVAA